MKDIKWTDVVMALFTIVIAGAAILQWREMVGGGTQTDKLVDYSKVQANASSDQADAAQQFSDTAEDINGRMQAAVDQLEATANSAKASIKATQDAMRQDQRAWLGAGDYTYTVAESGPIESVASVSNTGKSPALAIFARTTGITRPKGSAFNNSDIVYPVEMPTLKAGTLFPNQRIPLKAGGNLTDSGKQKVWFSNVQNGDWIQYFYGEIRYKDTFGRGHWTHFCTQFVPATKGGTPCPIYNETDDYQKHPN